MSEFGIDDALAALAAIEAIAAALIKTAPDAVARMGGAEAIVARLEMTAIGPMPRFSVEEWSCLAVEDARRHEKRTNRA